MSGAPVITDLAVDGMTCASCARRVERELAGGAAADTTAHVNLVTGRARVEHDGSVTPQALVERVERIGYSAHVVEDHAASAPHHDHVHGGAAGHGHEHVHASAGFGWRLAIAVPLTVPLLVWMLASGARPEHWEAWSLVLGTPVALVAAWPFHRVALRGARHRAATMDTLISIGVLASWGWSLVSWALDAAGTAVAGTNSYVEVAAVTTTLVLAGRVLEGRARLRAGAALRALLESGVREVDVLDADGTRRRVAASALRVGDRFEVRPGDRIAADGTVDDGESSIDRSIVTGESTPERTVVGDTVLGGTQNLDGRLVVRATRVGAETAVAQVARLVTEAQAGRASVQRLADQVSGVFVPVVLVLSILTLLAWALLGDVAGGISAAVAVLIVACPCALGLATPTALLVGSGRGAQMGIVIRGPEVIERARDVDTIVLDKTGTTTSGDFSVVATAGDPDAVSLAAAVEAGSEHPIARAIVAAAAAGAAAPAAATNLRNHPGRGVTADVDGRTVAVGGSALLDQVGATVDPALQEQVAAAAAANPGATRAWVAWDGAARAAILLRDEPRADSAAAVAALRRLGYDVLLATGDGADAAHAAAASVGIETVHAGLSPSDKADLVQQLQREGRAVAMVGDGINDSPALASARVGVAIGTGADVAIEASDLTLIAPSLWSVVDALRLSRATLRRIRGNLFWAFAYNVAALPLAMAGVLDPMIAGGAMAASSLFVVTGSLALRRFQPSPR